MVIYVINGYTIRKVNGQDVMYLFFDFNYEFSSFDFMAKREKIHDVVRNFIRDHNIVFKGATIALVAGGILFGSINLSSPSFSQMSMNNNVSIEEKVNDLKSNGDIGKTKEDISFNDNVNSSSKEVVVNTDSPSIVVDNKPDIVATDVSSNSSDVINNESISEPVVSSTVSEPIVNEPVLNEPIVDNNIYVSVRRSSGDVISLELEDYVIGVVSAEMPALFSSEALKAQAVIARTYALKANSVGRVLSDNESSQSYKSDGELYNLWGANYSSYYNRIRDAVMSTKGMYLTYNGNYIEAVYHSTSNGYTEDSLNVWGNYYPYLISVDSSFDNSNPSFSMSKSFSYDELSSKLGIDVSVDSVFNILGLTGSGRVSGISVDGNYFSGVDFRNKLGLRSADFDILKTDGGVVFTTRGYGHGVGMSQYGANGMGKAGYSFSDILFHYYPGVSLEQL